MKKVLFLALVIALVSCTKKKSSVEIWQDDKGMEVPVTVTQKGDTTVYDFGAMVMNAEPTQEEPRHVNANPCGVNYGHKLGMDTLTGCCQWEEFVIRLGAYYGSAGMSLAGLDETNWTFTAVALTFEGDSTESWWSMCDAERLFGHE